ncbi:MAG: ankyrin repeat domain-containing protein [Prevotella sp.]|nr:ankyrin repeat domain-containing protein [Prevotella sp.]
MMKSISILICSVLLMSCREYPVNKEKLLGWDYRLYQGTIAWDLAKAVDDEDTFEIRRQIIELKVPIDLKDSIFGGTLLMMAVRNNDEKSVEQLLILGANPNLYDDTVHSTGRNAVIYASIYTNPSEKILRLLLKYGGDPNSRECGIYNQPWGKESASLSALYHAVSTDALYAKSLYSIFSPNDFGKVKALTEAGANKTSMTEALDAAFVHNRMDIVLYLLEHGADYNRKFEEHDIKDNGGDSIFYTNILYQLRCCTYPLDSKVYNEKMEVVKFLRERGLNYWKSPIPDCVFYIIKQEIGTMSDEELKQYLKVY